MCARLDEIRIQKFLYSCLNLGKPSKLIKRHFRKISLKYFTSIKISSHHRDHGVYNKTYEISE